MRWFRSNITLGSRLALLALAVQFLLSFGHFHGGSAHAASVGAKRPGLHDAVSSAFAAVEFDAADLASPASVVSPVKPKTSSDHAPLGHLGEDCAICAVMALADTMLDAAPPLLVLPHATAFSYGPVAARRAEPDPVRVAFQPRAPPIA